jgi:hypothetical protein
LTDVLGHTAYQERVYAAYSRAKTRIISVISYWPIDDDYWRFTDEKKVGVDLTEDQWKTCRLYAKLSHCIDEAIKDDRSSLKEILFTGSLRGPTWTSGKNVIFSPDPFIKLNEVNFDRFIGLVWRLNVAHKLRLKLREAVTAYPDKKERLNEIAGNIRVVVAAVPISVSVVDNEVFILLRSPTMKERKIYGTVLTGHTNPTSLTEEESKVADEELADTYADFIHRHTRRYVRSGREYVEAIIRSAVIASNNLEDSAHIIVPTAKLETGEVTECMVISDKVRGCLMELGVKEWARSKARWYHKEDELSKPTNNSISSDTRGGFSILQEPSTYEWGAERILCTFFQYYWFHRHVKMDDQAINFYALRDDLL